MKIDYLKINSAFRYYKDMYQILSKFDRPVGNVKKSLFLKTLWLFNALGFHKLVEVYLSLRPIPKLDDTIASFVFSKNHLNILNSIRHFEIDLSSYFIGEIKPTNDKDLFISNFRIFLEALSISNLYDLLKEAENDKIMSSNFVRVFKVIGCSKIFSKISINHNYIFNYNDHMPYSVLLHDIAKEKDCTTIYMQHASVSDKFPELYHDHNILFSRDSLDKYGNNLNREVHILFDPRFSSIQNPNTYNKIKNRVLLCTNLLDEPERIEELIETLPNEYEIVLRPHPRDKRRDWNNLHIPISTELSVWNDLMKSEILVTNESAVILEGIFSNCLVYKAAFWGKSFDNYGYLKKNLLLKEHNNPKSLSISLENKVIEYDPEKLTYFIGKLEKPKKRMNDVFNKILEKKC